MIYKICFYTPSTHLEIIKNAMFAVGAGKIGEYSHCCWQTKGEGQFMPLAGSDPFLGTINQVEKVEEYKVEMICRDELIDDVILALKNAHPYETPAYQVTRVEDF